MSNGASSSTLTPGPEYGPQHPSGPHPFSGPSLLLRLCTFFSILVLVTWVFAALASWNACRKYADRFFDTQLLLFAKMLTIVDVGNLHDGSLPKSSELLRKAQLLGDMPVPLITGSYDAKALGFAIFDRSGTILLNDGNNGRNFIFCPDARGFSISTIIGSKEHWRFVCLPSFTGEHLVTVGQHMGYRKSMALTMLVYQLLPWALMVPILLTCVIVIVNREFGPLRHATRRLASRSPEDMSPLGGPPVPREISPFVRALDRLFLKMGSTLARERSFTANAAHELQTPLTALRIQAEVACSADDDEAVRKKALKNLLIGIDRSSHLVDQLLTLSRLDTMQEGQFRPQRAESPPTSPVNWPLLLDEAVACHHLQAEYKRIALHAEYAGQPAPRNGDSELCNLLLRNLFDNAVRYTPESGTIKAILDNSGLTIENTCATGPLPDITRLGERFFRPPGQQTRGSGLGLSIARQIASLHGFTLHLALVDTDTGATFQARLQWGE